MAEHIDSPPSSRSHADTDGSTHLMQAEEEIALDALGWVLGNERPCNPDDGFRSDSLFRLDELYDITQRAITSEQLRAAWLEDYPEFAGFADTE